MCRISGGMTRARQPDPAVLAVDVMANQNGRSPMMVARSMWRGAGQ
jgi:hypothetical protein